MFKVSEIRKVGWAFLRAARADAAR